MRASLKTELSVLGGYDYKKKTLLDCSSRRTRDGHPRPRPRHIKDTGIPPTPRRPPSPVRARIPISFGLGISPPGDEADVYTRRKELYIKAAVLSRRRHGYLDAEGGWFTRKKKKKTTKGSVAQARHQSRPCIVKTAGGGS